MKYFIFYILSTGILFVLSTSDIQAQYCAGGIRCCRSNYCDHVVGDDCNGVCSDSIPGCEYTYVNCLNIQCSDVINIYPTCSSGAACTLADYPLHAPGGSCYRPATPTPAPTLPPGVTPTAAPVGGGCGSPCDPGVCSDGVCSHPAHICDCGGLDQAWCSYVDVEGGPQSMYHHPVWFRVHGADVIVGDPDPATDIRINSRISRGGISVWDEETSSCIDGPAWQEYWCWEDFWAFPAQTYTAQAGDSVELSADLNVNDNWNRDLCRSPFTLPVEVDTGALLGRVYYDPDGNGFSDEPSSDWGIQRASLSCNNGIYTYRTIEGIQVEWSNATNTGQQDVNRIGSITGPAGCGGATDTPPYVPYYSFGGIPVGSYTVRLRNLPVGYAVTRTSPGTNCIIHPTVARAYLCDIVKDQGSHAWFGIGQSSCNISIPNLTVPVGTTQTVTFSYDSQPIGGFVTNVSYTSNRPANVQVTQFGATQARVTGLAEGGPFDPGYTAIATMNDGVTQCTATGSIAVYEPDPWWQVVEGDVTAMNGSVISNMAPVSICTTNCFMMMGNNIPGVPMGTGTIDPGDGEISTTNWKVNNSPYTAVQEFSYDYFWEKLPSNVNDQLVANSLGNLIGHNNLNGGGVALEGYRYYYYDGSSGDLNISGPPNTVGINGKVVLFANSNVNINVPIELTNGTEFFMLVAKGNIVVNGSLGNTASQDLEGVFFADGVFSTGASNLPLVVRGMVAAQDINLLRDMGVANLTSPAEKFIFAPDLVMQFPSRLSPKNVTWEEVAP